LTAVTLFGVLPIPMRLAAQNASSKIISFDAPGAGTRFGPNPVTEILQVGAMRMRRCGLRQLAERYSGTVGTGASGWDAQAERSMAMAAYAMTPVTTHRISVR
jgi:hypothetical protein